MRRNTLTREAKANDNYPAECGLPISWIHSIGEAATATTATAVAHHRLRCLLEQQKQQKNPPWERGNRRCLRWELSLYWALWWYWYFEGDGILISMHRLSIEIGDWRVLGLGTWSLESILNFFPPYIECRFLFWISSRHIEESISILNFFPPNRGVDFYFEFLPAKSRSRFLFTIILLM